MADATNTVGSTTGSAAQATAPAPSPAPAPSTQQSNARTAVIKSNADFIRDGFKNINPGILPDPNDAVAPASVPNQTDSQSDPAKARQPENTTSGDATVPPLDASSTATSETAVPADQQEPTGLPGDDIIKNLEGLAGEFAPKPAQDNGTAKPETAAPTTDEEIEKVINPEGKLNEQEKAKALRSYVGKQGREIGEMRQNLKVMATFVTKGRDGKVGFDLDKIADHMGPQAMRQYLADRQLKLVPANVKLADAPDPMTADAQSLINQYMPGDQLTMEEKLQEIKSDPILAAKFQSTLTQKESERRTQMDSQRKATQERINNEAKAFVDGLQKLPHYNELRAPLQYWNENLPNIGSFVGETRNKALRLLAEASRMPSVVKSVRDAAIKARDEHWQKRLTASGIQTNSGPGTHVDMNNRPQSGDAAAKAKAIRDSFGKL